VPQWRLRRAATLARAKRRLAHTKAGGEDWYWPEAEDPASRRWRPDDDVRLLAPFDPIVFDRRRFEIFWGWPYRFEAYVPPRSGSSATTRCRCCGVRRRGLGQLGGPKR
jgi:uncharacterized protein YcaQ